MQTSDTNTHTSNEVNNEFYNDEKALHLFKHSVEQEKQGLVREVSLEEIKQLLCISKEKVKQLGIK